MNLRFLSKIIGTVLCAAAACMLPSLLFSLADRDGFTSAFLISIAFGLLLGIPLARRPMATNDRLHLRDGFAIVAGCWVCLSFFCALPYWLGGALPNFADALFETASGLTTTGASVIRDVEALPKSILFWRSLTQFLGGMGILVLMLALLPRLGTGSVFLMKAESPGPIKSRLVPKIGESAKILYRIYLILIGAETLCLHIAGMSWFDSLCHAMCTVSTGGFSTKNTSLAYYDSLAVNWIAILFMFLSGISFALLFFLVRRDFGVVRKDEELRLYSGTVLGASVGIVLVLLFQSGSPISASLVTDVVFQVVTTITSTGFAMEDYTLWPTAAQGILLLLMLMGGCAGSTAGGVKPVRLLLLHKMMRRSVHRVIHPRQVRAITLNGKRVDEETLSTVCVFFYSYVFLLIAGTLILSFDQLGFSEAFSAALTGLGNIGPGMGALGPTSNFAALSVLSKLTITALMLIGRLEIFPILVLLSPTCWLRK